MRVHHLNCGTMCPPAGRLVRGAGSLFSSARLVCHCLLIETGAGLVLVDTGIGLADIQSPEERLGRGFAAVVRPALDPKETAIYQVEQLGFAPSDVRHIVLTHLDLDHAGGLSDFPAATVHLYRPEHDAAKARATVRERARYHPAQWAHGPRFRLYEAGGERWFGFERVCELEGLPPEILLVPVTGHTRGHAAIAVRTSAGGAPASLSAGGPTSQVVAAAPEAAPWSQRAAGWLLHAGDAYFHRGEMDPSRRFCPAALEIFQRAVAFDNEARLANQERLRALAREQAGHVRVFCAHDEVELERRRSEARAADLAAAAARPAA